MIILITASLSSKIYNIASLREELAFEETKSTFFTPSIFPGIFFRVRDVDKSSLYLFTLIRISVKNSNNQIPQVKRGSTVDP